MQRLIYSSVAAVALSAAELEALLGSSRELNEAAGITGILLHVTTPDPDVSGYVQWLEGEPGAVGETYARIKADELHREVTTLVDRPVPDRTFARWSMRLEQVPAGVLGEPDAIRDPAVVEEFFASYAPRS